MADRIVTFDADDVIRDLDIIRRVQMPFVASWALNKMAPMIRLENQQTMQRVFENPVPFTVNSVRWGSRGYRPWVRSDKQNLQMNFWISEDGPKGQAPSYYLYPQVIDDGAGGKQVYVTRFTKRLRNMGLITGNQYATPLIKESNVISDLLNGYGNIRPGQYTRILFALGAMEFPLAGYNKKRKNKDSFFISPNLRTGKKGLKPGIYRRKGSNFGMLFKTLDSPPVVPSKYDFYGTTTQLAREFFPELVKQKLDEVMRTG